MIKREISQGLQNMILYRGHTLDSKFLPFRFLASLGSTELRFRFRIDGDFLTVVDSLISEVANVEFANGSCKDSSSWSTSSSSSESAGSDPVDTFKSVCSSSVATFEHDSMSRVVDSVIWANDA